MGINYNRKGESRKELLAAIASSLHTKPKYMGAPTFSYQIGAFHLDKNGVLTWEDGNGARAEALRRSLEKAGFEGETDNGPDKRENVLAAPQEARDGATEDEAVLSISVPDDLTDEAYANLIKLVAGKKTIMQHAFKTDRLEIWQKDGSIAFPWFKAIDGDHTEAYSRFVEKLVKMAKESKRVVGTDHPVENEKYYFRCFLLRLGMIGAEYKGIRKILLENLDGSSAFRKGRKDA